MPNAKHKPCSCPKVAVSAFGAPTAASLVLGPPLDQLVAIAAKKLAEPCPRCGGMVEEEKHAKRKASKSD